MSTMTPRGQDKHERWDDRVGITIMVVVWLVIGFIGLGVKCGLL